MEIKTIRGIYRESNDIKPIGNAVLDGNGEFKKCPNCNRGILFIEWETGLTKCTICEYSKV